MERLTRRKSFGGLNGNALRTWGLLFLAAGAVGRGTLQAHLLGTGQVSTQQLLQIMSESETAMNFATTSLILQAIETCAAPIFAALLVEGIQHTRDFRSYFLRVLGVALVSEIPYNLAMGAGILDLGTRNPVFGLVICMALVYFYRLYPGKKIRNVLIKVLVTVAAVLWCEMLKVTFGSALVIVVAVMWALRTNPLYRNFAGAAAAIVCSAISPFFLLSPMGFLAVHLYNGEKSTNSRTLNYLAYPVILAAAAAAGIVLKIFI